MKIMIVSLIILVILISASMIPSRLDAQAKDLMTPHAENLLRERIKTAGVNTGGFAYDKYDTDYLYRNGNRPTSPSAAR